MYPRTSGYKEIICLPDSSWDSRNVRLTGFSHENDYFASRPPKFLGSIKSISFSGKKGELAVRRTEEMTGLPLIF